MNIILWIVQIVIALLFLLVGSKKIFSVIKGKESINNTEKTANNSLIVFVGIVEILGAVGLILPWLLDIIPILTPLAAIGISIIMILATIFHVKHKEFKPVFTTISLLALSLFVAIGRLI